MREWGEEGKIENGAKVDSAQPVSRLHPAAYRTHVDKVSLAGRVASIREAGPKLRFYDLRADGHKVQVMAQAQ